MFAIVSLLYYICSTLLYKLNFNNNNTNIMNLPKDTTLTNPIPLRLRGYQKTGAEKKAKELEISLQEYIRRLVKSDIE